MISDQSSRSAPKESPSLVGKSLPDLSGLKIEPAPDDISDKNVLVCFFDMQQRPSRHCISRLVNQAEQLKQKGIIVVAVQAADVDKVELDKWTKENNIPFAIGIIKGDKNKVRFSWGVKALPWLILTDKNHTVTAEGFGIDEIEEKIKDIGK